MRRLAAISLMVCLVVLCGCPQQARYQMITLEVNWPVDGRAIGYILSVDEATLDSEVSVLLDREKKLKTEHSREILLTKISAASGIDKIDEKIDLLESKVVFVELKAAFPANLKPTSEGNIPVPASGGEAIKSVSSHIFVLHPVTVKIRGNVGKDEKSKLEQALKDMKIYSLKGPGKSPYGYYYGKTEKEAIEKAMEPVIAFAHIGLKKSTPVPSE